MERRLHTKYQVGEVFFFSQKKKKKKKVKVETKGARRSTAKTYDREAVRTAAARACNLKCCFTTFNQSSFDVSGRLIHRASLVSPEYVLDDDTRRLKAGTCSKFSSTKCSESFLVAFQRLDLDLVLLDLVEQV